MVTFTNTGKFVSLVDGQFEFRLWLLNGPYDIEVACYIGGIVQLVAAKVKGNSLIGDFPYFNGSIGWIINKANSFSIGAEDINGVAIGPSWVGVLN